MEHEFEIGMEVVAKESAAHPKNSAFILKGEKYKIENMWNGGLQFEGQTALWNKSRFEKIQKANSTHVFGKTGDSCVVTGSMPKMKYKG